MSGNPYSAPVSHGKPPESPLPSGGKSLPGAALAIAIIGIGIGALNFFGSCCGVAGLAGFSAMANSTAVQEAMQENAAKDPDGAAQFDLAKEQIAKNMVPIVIQMGLGLILGAMLLAGGIGTLARKEWGRNLLVIACLAGIAVTIINIVISVAMGNFANMANVPDDQKMFTMIAMVSGLAFTALYLVYYIWGWRYLSAPQRRAWFS